MYTSFYTKLGQCIKEILYVCISEMCVAGMNLKWVDSGTFLQDMLYYSWRFWHIVTAQCSVSILGREVWGIVFVHYGQIWCQPHVNRLESLVCTDLEPWTKDSVLMTNNWIGVTSMHWLLYKWGGTSNERLSILMTRTLALTCVWWNLWQGTSSPVWYKAKKIYVTLIKDTLY